MITVHLADKLKRVAADLTLDAPGRREESLSEHRQLVRAYRAKDVLLAGLLSRLVHLNALRTMEQCLTSREGEPIGASAQ